MAFETLVALSGRCGTTQAAGFAARKFGRAFLKAIRALALAVSLVPTSAAWAQTWDGGGSNNNWTTANNWNPNGAPVNDGTADITFSGNTRLRPNANGAKNINSLTFDSAAGAFVSGGSILTINGGGILSSATVAETINNNIVLGANQTWTVSDPASTLTVRGIVSGGSALNKAGDGTLTLSGANTYTGDTTVSAGTLLGNTTSLQGNIVDNANVTFNQTFSGTYAGMLSGSGTLTKIGSGTVTLSGANTYSGGTTVSAGILQGVTTSLQGNILDNANVTFNQTAVGTYSGILSGTGSLTKTGAGTLTLSGANTYTGGTTVSVGILQGDTTSLRGNIVDNANVTFNQAAAGTYTGILSGSGSLTKTGAGTLTLSGANTYTGGTTVSAGVLEGNTTSLQRNIVNNANVTFNQAAAGTYTGIMSGTGSLTKTGFGTLILSGANTYTGGTTVSAGTLQGNSTSLRGNILDNANVTFNQTSSGTYAGILSGTGSLTKIGSSTLTLTGANTYTGGTTVSAGILQGDTTSLQGDIVDNANVTFNQAAAGTYSDVISGTGSLTKTGAGTLTLSGANTYSGGTTVLTGVLQGDTTSLQGNIANSANVTFDQAAAGTYSGVMSGSGNLTKTGAGTLTLSGVNTYSGGTTVSDGILQGDTTSLQRNIFNNAEVTFDQAATGTYSDIMSGSGSLLKTGAGTLTLSGANTYTGGTTVSAGTLVGNTTSLRGDILDNANVMFNQSSSGTYAGILSGTGSLTKIGSGTLTLSGANTYSGGTTVSAGILQGDTTSLQGNILDNARVTFNQTTTGTYAGIISGTGTLFKLGTGTVILSGANTYTGGTTVSAGVLQGDTTSLQRNIANSANVTFNQDVDGTYSGVMSGSGSLTKTGAGTVSITGANTYTGLTTIDAGRLAVDGSLARDVLVNPNGTLGGSGTIGRDVTNLGTVAAGNSIGTLTVNDDFTQAAGGAMDVEIDDGGTTPGVNNDLVSVGDTTTLSGGTVNVIAAPGSYLAGTQYTFLTSSGGVSGAFDGATDNIPLLHAVLGYTGGSAYFTLTFDQTNFAAIAETFNELAVATYLDAISTSATGDLQTVLTGLSTLGDNQQRAAFNQMGGEIYGSLGQVGLQQTTLVLAQLSQRIRYGTLAEIADGPILASAEPAARSPIVLASYSPTRDAPPVIAIVHERPADAWTGWAFGLGLGGKARTDGNASGLGYDMGGTLLGIERELADNERFGFFGGYLGTQLHTTPAYQRGSIQSGQFGAYNYHDDGFNYYSLIGGLQFSGYDSRRLLQFDGIDRAASGNFSGWQGYAYLERGVKFQAAGSILQPFAALQYIYLRQNSFVETGADSLNLNVAGLDANSLRSQLGGRLQLGGLSGIHGRLVPEVRAIWLHEFLETTSVVNSFFAPIGGGSFAVQGLNLGRDWALLGGGLRWDRPNGWSLFGNYDAQVNSQQVFHVGSGGVSYQW
jgi:autotransporter-associated beta strand protein